MSLFKSSRQPVPGSGRGEGEQARPPPDTSWFRLRTINGHMRDRLLTEEQADRYRDNPDWATVQPIDADDVTHDGVR